MSKMIERVAEAIRLRAIERGQPIHPVMVHHLAAAAIEAMREPTEEMLEAAWHETVAPPSNVSDLSLKELYKIATALRHGVMIDEALKPIVGQ